jgi:hypothetical protein
LILKALPTNLSWFSNRHPPCLKSGQANQIPPVPSASIFPMIPPFSHLKKYIFKNSALTKQAKKGKKML